MKRDGDRDARGFRVKPGAGATVRADVVDLWVVRRRRRGVRGRAGGGLELLQVLRSREPLRGTWQPVMGHIERGETAWRAAAREAREEVGLDVRGPDALEFLALEQVHPFYIAAIDCVVLSPRFVAVVVPGWEPTLNEEHSAHRWVGGGAAAVRRAFLWPGQWAAAREIVQILTGPEATRAALRVGSDARGRRRG